MEETCLLAVGGDERGELEVGGGDEVMLVGKFEVSPRLDSRCNVVITLRTCQTHNLNCEAVHNFKHHNDLK